MSAQAFGGDIFRTVAELLAISARTAPKAAGKDYVIIETVDGEALQKLGDAMVKYGETNSNSGFIRDGRNVKDSASVILIGLKAAEPVGLNCGACGYERCADLKLALHEGREFAGPSCVMRLLDMGIALGSAVKTASMLNVDNRIMYRIGVLARKLGLVDADVVMGIPLSATGKSIYFDRKK